MLTAAARPAVSGGAIIRARPPRRREVRSGVPKARRGRVIFTRRGRAAGAA